MKRKRYKQPQIVFALQQPQVVASKASGSDDDNCDASIRHNILCMSFVESGPCLSPQSPFGDHLAGYRGSLKTNLVSARG